MELDSNVYSVIITAITLLGGTVRGDITKKDLCIKKEMILLLEKIVKIE